jgi:hypothetical protein
MPLWQVLCLEFVSTAHKPIELTLVLRGDPHRILGDSVLPEVSVMPRHRLTVVGVHQFQINPIRHQQGSVDWQGGVAVPGEHPRSVGSRTFRQGRLQATHIQRKTAPGCIEQL